MWWPSFVSVLRDLFFFVIGKQNQVAASDHNKDQITTSKRPDPVLVSSRAPVKLVEDQHYDASHLDVIRIREKLAQYDAHLAQKHTLTMREWLLYFVHNKRPSTPLLALQMTPIGSWHVTLKGQVGITIGISPYSGAIMEWGSDLQTSHAAVVLKVTPEETITYAQLGLDQPGTYTTKTVSKKDWLELRPVFTTIV